MNLSSEIGEANTILQRMVDSSIESKSRDEEERIKKGKKATIEYIICNYCNQKFEPFYFGGANEFGIIQDKIDECPSCKGCVSFANPININSKEQKIKIFEYLHPSEIEEFGIIRYNKRTNDIEEILKKSCLTGEILTEDTTKPGNRVICKDDIFVDAETKPLAKRNLKLPKRDEHYTVRDTNGKFLRLVELENEKFYSTRTGQNIEPMFEISRFIKE